MLYIIKKDTVDVNAIETQNGYRCLIEDISESGALIRIGGKGAQNVKIKLQYNIQNKLILMVGVVRTVEYNQEQNQSLLHFECTHIETSMRNEVLKFVYNMMPQSEKEVLEALEQTETDEKDSISKLDTAMPASENSEAKPENKTDLKPEVAAQDPTEEKAKEEGAAPASPSDSGNTVISDDKKSEKAGENIVTEDEINVFQGM